MAQMFNSSSLSKIKRPFQKVVFTRHIAMVSGKDKLILALVECQFATTSFDLWMLT